MSSKRKKNHGYVRWSLYPTEIEYILHEAKAYPGIAIEEEQCRATEGSYLLIFNRMTWRRQMIRCLEDWRSYRATWLDT